MNKNYLTGLPGILLILLILSLKGPVLARDMRYYCAFSSLAVIKKQLHCVRFVVAACPALLADSFSQSAGEVSFIRD